MTTIHIDTETRDDLADLATAKRLGVGELAIQVLREYAARPENARVITAVRAARDLAASEKGPA
jgi:hypothetical protein